MSLYQRGNVWYYLFYVNGKRYRGSTKTENEKEAGRIYARAQLAAEAGESTKPKRAPLVQEFVKEFKDWLDKSTLKKRTQKDYQNGCRLILLSDLRGLRLDQVSKDDIETTNFHSSLASRDCAMRTLRRMLGKARDRHLIRDVPRVKRLKVPGRERMVTDADEQQILSACPRPLRDVLIIMLDAGMRNGEVVRMRWEHINWEAASSFNPEGKTPRARRQVPLSERVLEVLRTIRHEQEHPAAQTRVKKRKRKANLRKPDFRWVFPSTHSPSGHIELSGLEHRFRKIARELGIPDDLKIYCARHTFGTVAMAETGDPGLVRVVMGHESLTTTMKYLHPETANIKAVIDRRNLKKMAEATDTNKNDAASTATKTATGAMAAAL
jgi:integrase